MYDRTSKTPRFGTTDWAARQFLRMLDQEEQEKAQLRRLEAAGWRPTTAIQPAGRGEVPVFGDGRDTLVNLIQADVDRRQALQDEARRRARIARGGGGNSMVEGAPESTQLAQAQSARPVTIPYKTVPLQMRHQSMPVPDTVANPDDWYAFHDALRRSGMTSETEIEGARKTFGHEGGMEVDRGAGGCDKQGRCDPGVAGLLKSYMKDAKRRGLSQGLPTNPYRLTPEDTARWYKIYMDDSLHNIGGSDALGRIRDRDLAGEIADALFQHGRSKGAQAIQEAANVVMAMVPQDIRERFDLAPIVTKDPDSPRTVGPTTMTRVKRLVDLGLGAELREALARQRAIIYPPKKGRRGVQRRYDSYR